MTPIDTEVYCGACGEPHAEPVGAIPFYLTDREIATAIFRCTKCGTYIRDINFDDPKHASHFDVASYTDPFSEEKLRAIRSGYFRYLTRRLEGTLGRSLHDLRVLDVGSAYGHYLVELKAAGACPEGVEIVSSLRDRANKQGFIVHAQIPSESEFDIITIIDSLYYMDDPSTALRQLRGILSQKGRVMVRVANRTWLLDLMRSIGIHIGRGTFGDAKFNFSYEGMLVLMERSGFQVEDVIWTERGKDDPRWHMRQYYKFAPVLSHILPRNISPGLILVGRPTVHLK